MQISIPPLLQSKKFGAAVIASVLSFAGVQRGMSPKDIAMVTASLYAYIGAQGIADFGKERAKVDRLERLKPNAKEPS